MDEDWLNAGPQPGLLESDIASSSFNKMPWNHGAASSYHDDDFLSTLKISETGALATLTQRYRCPRCHASRKYFCYSCFEALPETRDLIPIVEPLPIYVDIIKHPCEVDGKSTAVHAKVHSPSSVRIFSYPDIPAFDPDRQTYLLFPGGDDAMTLDELFSESRKIDRIVLIDSTWSQCSQICQDPRMKVLPKIKLDKGKTCFWRGQRKADDHLATIEAVYFFLRSYHRLFISQNYLGDYDNLLFLYKFMRERIN